MSIMMKFFMNVGLVGMGLLLVSELPASADTVTSSVSAPVCAVPVCDISAQLASLNALPQSGRYQMLTHLRSTYKGSKDMAVLKNLADFGSQAVRLLKSLNEEDWLVREAQGLADDSNLGMAKYSPLISRSADSAGSSDAITGYFAQLRGEGPRFEVITYWENQIVNFEDRASLLSLSALFQNFSKISTAAQDPDYVSREAMQAEDKVTQKIVEIDPFFEGTYDLISNCGHTGADQVACGDFQPDHMTIMNTFGAAGLEVSLSNQESGIVLYQFSNVILSDGGKTLEASSESSGTIGKLHLDMDAGNHGVTGWMKSSRGTLQLIGNLVMSPSSVFDEQEADSNSGDLTSESLTGTYRGTLDRQAFTLVVRVLDTNEISASLSFDSLPSQYITFQNVHFLPKRGVLSLVSSLNNGSRMKLVLFFKENPDGIAVQGMEFDSLNGGNHLIRANK